MLTPPAPTASVADKNNFNQLCQQLGDWYAGQAAGYLQAYTDANAQAAFWYKQQVKLV